MTSPVGALGATGPSVASHTSDATQAALGGLGSDGFLKLLVAQLRYQSPLDPSDPTDLMLQTAQLAQLDATQQLVSLQRRDLGLQQAVAAAALVGTTVTGTTSDGNSVQGVVDAVRYTTAGPVLRIGEHELPLGAVTEVAQTTPSTD